MQEATVSEGFIEVLGYLLGKVAFWDAVAWPFATVLCVIILRGPINTLFKGIGRLFDKDWKINPKTGDIEINQKSMSTTEEDIKSGRISIEAALEGHDYLKNKIIQLGPHIDTLIDASGVDPQDWLKARFIEYVLAHAMEIIYRNIYGSQIKALIHLSDERTCNKAALLRYYSEAEEEYTDFYARYSFDSWLFYLKQASLIGYEDGSYHITDDGDAFLKYISHHGYRLDKVF